MNDFLLIFRSDAPDGSQQSLSPEQMQARMKPWQDWMGSIAAQDKLVAAGNRLEHKGCVIRPDNIVTDGPYVETKEAIGGYTIIRAASLEEAKMLSMNCPILGMNGGSVEVRPIVPMEV